MKKLRKKLYAKKNELQIEFVHGPGTKKSKLQKSMEELEKYIDRAKGYIMSNHICGDRNSYSKTDHDATFMRMKEDSMRNDQLKPAYNVQHAVDSEYIVWASISSQRADTWTFKPFLSEMEPEILEDESMVPVSAGFSLSRYLREVFRMFGTEAPVHVELLCRNYTMNSIIDHFGTKIRVEVVDEDHFRIEPLVCASPTFYRWVFGFCIYRLVRAVCTVKLSHLSGQTEPAFRMVEPAV